VKIPVHVWERGGRTISLLGAVHIGTPEYYTQMRTIIDEAETAGAVVHVEGTRAKPDPTATAQEKDWMSRMPGDGYGEIAEALGLVTQKTLGYKDSWENHDLTLLEVLRGVPDPEGLVSDLEKFTSTANELQEVPALAKIMRWVVTSGVLRLARRFSGGGDLKEVHPLREKVAVNAMLKAEGDVLAVWGMAHLRGMGKLLRKNGWRRLA
jgi:hypothetical protein